jgi:alpha-glucosidase
MNPNIPIAPTGDDIKHRLIAVILCGLVPVVGAENATVSSPNGKHSLAFEFQQGGLTYSITSDDKIVIPPTSISLTISGTSFPRHGSTGVSRRKQIRETTIPTVPTFSASFPNAFNELSIRFGDDITVCGRAYDDGIAFRWETHLSEKEVTIDAEKLAITFASDIPVYFPEPLCDGFFSHQECNFARMPVSAVKDHKPGCVPLLADRGNDQWLLFSDVNVEAYPGVWLEGTGSNTLMAAFPPYPLETRLKKDRSLEVFRPASFIARTTGTRSFPWRAFVMTDGAGLLKSTMLYNLAEPSRLDDTSWIKPGKVAWDWWNANNIHGVPFRAGINQDTYKHYIDFAAEMGLSYIILDEGWSVPGPDNLLKVVPEIDMQALSDYGRSKNVRLILWMTSVALERSFGAALDQFEKWGIAGIKVDFMQRDDQVMMEFLYRVAAAAADHHLLADFHGGSKPTGLHRTWPNVLTCESVLGLEQSKWGTDASPSTAALLPFVRMVVGPMDYTPGAMINLQRKSFQPMFETPASQGTRAQQLAMYIVFLSPLQMLADTPTNYRGNPQCLPFLRAVPVTWDDTRVLHAKVGECLAVARRKGNEWYIGAINDWKPRDLELSLDFLGGGLHEMVLWRDGPNADRNGNDVLVEPSQVSQDTKLKLHLAPGGGATAIIRTK